MENGGSEIMTSYHDAEEEEDFEGRECYVFNTVLSIELNDTKCIHCGKFMTLRCENIDEFIEEE